MASKLKCKFGAKCYRKNPQHLKEEAENGEYRYSERYDEKLNSICNDDVEPAAKRQKTKQIKESPKAANSIENYFTKKKDDKIEDDNSKESEDDKPGTSTSAIPSDDTPEDSEVDEEEDDSPSSPENVKENIKRKFLVEMPPDFYDMWEFCEKRNPKNPTDALDVLGLMLVGPYDILAGKHKKVTKNKQGKRPNFLLHWRYYYDPPEFLTVIKGGDKTQFHLGYFRDDPEELPALVASNNAAENGLLVPKGDNLFAAIKWCAEDHIRNQSPNNSQKKKLQNLLEDITSLADAKGYNLNLRSNKMKDRDKKVVCKGFHKAGIVVPVDENEIGYRELPETLAARKKMYKDVVEATSESDRDKKFDPIQDMVTLVQFANDECDYGEGLELGIDMFSYGGKVFHPMISHLLPLAYQLLGRLEYKQIIEAHLKRRRSDANLSQLE